MIGGHVELQGPRLFLPPRDREELFAITESAGAATGWTYILGG